MQRASSLRCACLLSSHNVPPVPTPVHRPARTQLVQLRAELRAKVGVNCQPADPPAPGRECAGRATDGGQNVAPQQPAGSALAEPQQLRPCHSAPREILEGWARGMRRRVRQRHRAGRNVSSSAMCSTAATSTRSLLTNHLTPRLDPPGPPRQSVQAHAQGAPRTVHRLRPRGAPPGHRTQRLWYMHPPRWSPTWLDDLDRLEDYLPHLRVLEL